MAKSYEASGVNLEAGYEVVSRIKKHVASTNRPGCMGNIGALEECSTSVRSATNTPSS